MLTLPPTMRNNNTMDKKFCVNIHERATETCARARRHAQGYARSAMRTRRGGPRTAEF